jgi:hypothetical protein
VPSSQPRSWPVVVSVNDKPISNSFRRSKGIVGLRGCFNANRARGEEKERRVGEEIERRSRTREEREDTGRLANGGKSAWDGGSSICEQCWTGFSAGGRREGSAIAIYTVNGST